jgi:hypothetical protein
MDKILKKILNNTLFLAKFLDDFDGFYIPGKDYQIIACCSSANLIAKYPNIIVYEVIKGMRTYSTSSVILNIFMDYLKYTNNKDYSNYWTYQAYPWTNDLKYAGKNVFAIDYFLFLRLQNKLTQRKILLEQCSSIYSLNCSLSRNLTNSAKKLQTIVFPKGIIDYDKLKNKYKGSFVICSSYSDGGEGVYKISTQSEYINAISQIKTPVIRVEKYIQNSIPVNQIAFVTSNGNVIKYSPSIQIIKNIHQNNKMEYSGCDFSCRQYFENAEKTIENITSLTHWIGKILYNIGYRGTFGCDYLIEGGNTHFIELNPRYQASTRIPTLTMHNNPILSPHILHILGFIPIPKNFVSFLETHDHEYKYIDIISQKKGVRGFINIYNGDVPGLRKPLQGVALESGLSIGYALFENNIISSPFFPTQLISSFSP